MALRRCNSGLHNPLSAILAHITASAIWAMALCMAITTWRFTVGMADVVGFLCFFWKFWAQDGPLETTWPETQLLLLVEPFRLRIRIFSHTHSNPSCTKPSLCANPLATHSVRWPSLLWHTLVLPFIFSSFFFSWTDFLSFSPLFKCSSLFIMFVYVSGEIPVFRNVVLCSVFFQNYYLFVVLRFFYKTLS